MSELQTYERLITQKTTGKLFWQKLSLITTYFLWLALCFSICTRTGITAPMLIFIPLSTAVLIFFTWKYVQVEFEYILGGNTFFLTRIYGKRKRKPLLEVPLKSTLLIAPSNADSIKKAETLSPTDTVWAISSPKAQNIWFLIYDEDKEKRIMLFFEADDRSLRILRHSCPRVTAREALTFLHGSDNNTDKIST